jgi:hypothetical protein
VQQPDRGGQHGLRQLRRMPHRLVSDRRLQPGLQQARGTVPGCCTYKERDCAGEFGNAPGFAYSGSIVNNAGVCRAKPL